MNNLQLLIPVIHCYLTLNRYTVLVAMLLSTQSVRIARYKWYTTLYSSFLKTEAEPAFETSCFKVS